ncbi:MAG: histidine--tRNA ligase [Candidatus Omnitrophica bacterium CG11_big_fil_rev_8_21_14_0_20_64_10]|nr:MAG: histidine--tRNA ligase [Candidatus Omnitrophica bacterium CG11_big_fil_rev_8_21_14_0_20_64_10]
MSPVKALGGTSDLFPPETLLWQRLESQARRVAHLYGFEEIRTPLIEMEEVFTGSLGEAAEIVTKQMYRFEDRGGRAVTLRPEGTAPIVRAFVEKGLDKTASLSRFYYLGPMFRAERPQAGRRRQFHQFGVELFGASAPAQDVEVLALLNRLLTTWGLTGWTIRINTLGSAADRPRVLEYIREQLAPHASRLKLEERERLTKNPLRILDSKEPELQKLCARLDFTEVLSAGAKERFEQVLAGLKAVGVPFTRDPRLVRGLDYYTDTVFEIVHSGLGAQDAIGGGGRYDNLVRSMGGVAVPAIGFAVGLERILLALEAGKETPAVSGGTAVFVAAVTPAEVREGLVLAERLRAEGIAATAELEGRALKRQLEQAVKSGCRLVVIRSENERAKKVVSVKDLSTREQKEIPEADWVAEVRGMLNSGGGA